MDGVFFSRNGSRVFPCALARFLYYLCGIFIFSAHVLSLSLSLRLFRWMPFYLLKRSQIRSVIKIIFTIRYVLRTLRALRLPFDYRIGCADFNDFRHSNGR